MARNREEKALTAIPGHLNILGPGIMGAVFMRGQAATSTRLAAQSTTCPPADRR